MTEADVLDPDVGQSVTDVDVAESMYFVVRVAGLAYALPPEVVELVAPEQSPVPVPTAQAHVRGVVHVRGRISAVVDLGALLGLAPVGGDPVGRRLIVLSVDGVGFSFVADETLGLVPCAGAPGAAEVADRPVCGRFEHAGQVVAVLDPVGLLRAASGA